MSHFSTYKTEIKNLSVQSLKELVTAFAKAEGLKVVEKLNDYYRGQKIDIALMGKGIERGIGFSVENGTVVVKGDAWMQRDFNRIRDLAPAYMRAMIVARNAPNVFGAKLRGVQTQIKGDQVVQVLEVCE